MFRALLWKEWRQLALVRWGGIALGAVLPIAFAAGAELAKRGLLPTGSVKGSVPRDLMYELLPAALALGLWPLIGLMSAASSFAGDHVAGTETFLVERPVPRVSVWRARLLASFGTLVSVIAATAVLAAIAAAFTGAPPGTGWAQWAMSASPGVAVGLLAYLGGLIAASLLASPLGAVLLGAVLGAVPAVLAAQLAIVFSYARVGSVFLGIVVPFLLLPAYIAASWLAFCRGEPAGRGRIRRAVTLLGAALAGVLVLFVILAPLAVRANAGIGQHAVYPARSGGQAIVASTNFDGNGGWIVDVATGTKRVFVPPPIQHFAWSPEGSEVVILTWSGPLGSARGYQRMDIRSAANGRVLRSIRVADDSIVYALTWADAGLAAVVSRGSSRRAGHAEVEIVDPITGAWRPTGFRSEGLGVSLVGPVEDRRVFVRTTVVEKNTAGQDAPRGYHLHPVDVAAARVGPAMVDASGRVLTFAGRTDGLSSSGRFARIVGEEDDSDRSRITDFRAGADGSSVLTPPWARWISGDRLVWHDDLEHRTRMFVGTPGAPPKVLREWRDAQVGVQPSPDGRAIFVSVIPAGGAPASDAKHRPPDAALFEGAAPAGGTPEELVYLPDDDRFVRLGPPFSDRASDHRYTQWAGPKTLARIAPGVVYFEDIDAPGKRRFVIGGARNLE